MGAKCPAGQYWDSLIKKCLHCNVMCQQPLVITKCTKYCANCKTLPGHYYDGLLMKCVKCGDVCGRHPAECFLHCHGDHFEMAIVGHSFQNSSNYGIFGFIPVYPSILLYALLALCMVLLVSSLCLALVIFLRRRSETNADRAVVKQGQGSAQRRGQHDFILTDLMAHARGATEPSDESSPTETCVCVHCYPDPITVVSNNRAPSRAPMAYDQQAVLHHALICSSASGLVCGLRYSYSRNCLW
uniref:TACI cysteine-rich domain-containing protein n=1 Tax=Hippocampus comes TaxID=109280 RepID=A0A3Q2Y3C3_HIPCM